MIICQVTGAAITVAQNELLTTGMVQAVPVRFRFSPQWAALDRTAVFTAGTVRVSGQLGEDNQCIIPRECLTRAGEYLRVGVYGTRGEKMVLPTVSCLLGPICTGTQPEENTPTEATPTLVQSLLTKAEAAVSVADALRTDADAGLFNGRDGKDGTNGQDGKDGIDGVDGKDGNTPFIGDNGNWWIAGSDTGVKAQGADGADGQNGENGKDGICSGYFFADCSISGHRLLQNYAVTPYFTQKLNSGDLVSCSQNKVTLKKGHTYMVCLSGSIGVSSNDNNGNLCVVMKDGYDDTTCKNATRIYQYYAPNSKPKVPLYQYSITYNRIYNAKNNDISLTYSFEQENYNTVLDTLSCTYTVIALD